MKKEEVIDTLIKIHPDGCYFSAHISSDGDVIVESAQTMPRSTFKAAITGKLDQNYIEPIRR